MCQRTFAEGSTQFGAVGEVVQKLRRLCATEFPYWCQNDFASPYADFFGDFCIPRCAGSQLVL